jgi:hypothetical protein
MLKNVVYFFVKLALQKHQKRVRAGGLEPQKPLYSLIISKSFFTGSSPLARALPQRGIRVKSTPAARFLTRPRMKHEGYEAILYSLLYVYVYV